MFLKSDSVISDAELRGYLAESLKGRNLKRVLLLPPDYTRMYSGAGKITAFYYELLKDTCEVDVMPALGTHVPMTEEECEVFFLGKIPFDRIVVHNWRTDVVKIGEVPGSFVSEVSEGLVETPIDVEVNKRIMDKSYDLIISAGQVVPHEVVGMANYSKNIFVGCGGSSMINSSHMLGAFYGMERIMGRDFSPVRRVFDYAQEHFMKEVPLLYVLTVTTNTGDVTNLHGLYIGTSRNLFEMAVAHSQEKNLNHMDKPLKTVVVYLDPREFKSTWLGNKAIYRTRMAIADNGTLIVLAPGLHGFGEDPENDRLIAKYGYRGTPHTLKCVEENEDLRNNLSAAAHLIHGSSEGRFTITYCPGNKVSAEEIRNVGFEYGDLQATMDKYDFANLKDGINVVNGEEIFYISNPALGLWALKSAFTE